MTTYPHPRPRRADVTHRERLRQGALTLVTIGALYATWLSVGLPALPLALPDPPAAHVRTTVVAQLATPSLARIEAAIAARETRGGLSSGLHHTRIRASRPGGTAATRSGATPTDTGGRATALPPGVPPEPRQTGSPAPPPSQQEASPPPADAVTQVVNGVVANQATQLVDETRNSVEQTVAPAVDAATQLLPPAPLPPKTGSGLNS